MPSPLALALLTLSSVALSPYSHACAAPETETSSILDMFSDATSPVTLGPRIVITDQAMGGTSHADQSVSDGIITVKGELIPGRGSPAFVSLVLPLESKGQPRDRAHYEGVRLRVRVHQGTLSVQVGSADIQNFDYHTSAPLVRKGDGFQEVKVPFKALKRVWSEQTPLNLAAITSVNLVVAGMQKGTFAYQLDEIGFY